MKARLIKILVIVAISIAVLYLAGIYLVNKAFDMLILSQIGEININQELEALASDNSNKFQEPEKKDNEENKDIPDVLSSVKSDTVQNNEKLNNDGKKDSDANNSNTGINTGIKETNNTEDNATKANIKEADTTKADTTKTNNIGANDTDNNISGTNNSGSSENNKPSGETPGTSRQEVAITDEKVKEIENKVSLSDKGKALQIVASRLKAEDISLLRSMAKNGITAEEIEKAKKILKARITEEEKEFLKELLSKYNVLP